MSDSDISALRDEIRSLNTTLTRLGEKVEGWLSFFWLKLLAIGAAILVYGFLIIEMIIHW